MMNKKLWGILLSAVLFTMCPLTASAAEMVPAPVTSDQMVQIANAAMTGVTSYRLDHILLSDITSAANPGLSGTGLMVKYMEVSPNVVHVESSESMSVAGITETEYTEAYITREGNYTKVYQRKNGRAWAVMKLADNGQKLAEFSLIQILGLNEAGVGQTGVPVYTDGEVFQFTETNPGNQHAYVMTFDALTMLPIGSRYEQPMEDAGSGLLQNGSIDIVISDFNMYDTLTIPPEIVASAIPLN